MNLGVDQSAMRTSSCYYGMVSGSRKQFEARLLKPALFNYKMQEIRSNVLPEHAYFAECFILVGVSKP